MNLLKTSHFLLFFHWLHRWIIACFSGWAGIKETRKRNTITMNYYFCVRRKHCSHCRVETLSGRKNCRGKSAASTVEEKRLNVTGGENFLERRKKSGNCNMVCAAFSVNVETTARVRDCIDGDDYGFIIHRYEGRYTDSNEWAVVLGNRRNTMNMRRVGKWAEEQYVASYMGK